MSPGADDVQHLRPLLFSIAYRMLGSVGDAEDIVQEAFVQADAVSMAFLLGPVAQKCFQRYITDTLRCQHDGRIADRPSTTQVSTARPTHQTQCS